MIDTLHTTQEQARAECRRALQALHENLIKQLPALPGGRSPYRRQLDEALNMEDVVFSAAAMKRAVEGLCSDRLGSSARSSDLKAAALGKAFLRPAQKLFSIVVLTSSHAVDAGIRARRIAQQLPDIRPASDTRGRKKGDQ